nr:MAG TPA: hypothetical protein [Siphoviridae sp. ctoD011]
MICLRQILYISVMQVQIHMKQLIMLFSLDTHRGKRQPKQKGEMCKVWWCLENLETDSFFFA